MHNFVRSGTSIEDSESTPYAHKYLVKRPIIKEHLSTISSNLRLQPSNHGGAPAITAPLSPDSTNEAADNHILEKRRFELFIDLIWVGIIGDLADTFSDEAFSETSDTPVGRAIGNFILLFVTAWRLWKFLQVFMSKYHTNDLIERLFVVWILMLALLYGNNAPYLLIIGEEQSNLAIIVYLVARASFLVIESVYSLYMPFLRRGMLIRAVTAVLLSWIWIGTIFVSKDRKIFVLIAANTLEVLLGLAIGAPLLSHFLREERAKVMDPDHWIERIREFFVIILGEGVLNLIRGSPLGRGITSKSGNGISVLIVYYALNGFYFSGDQSRRYIHAVKRAWWRQELWQFFHVALFHATLILGVGAGFLVEHPSASALDKDEALASHIFTAKWVFSISLATVLVMQTLIALLSKSLDGKWTLKVDNRYLRLLPRLAAVAVALCLPIREQLVASVFLTILVLMLVVILLWEWDVLCLARAFLRMRMLQHPEMQQSERQAMLTAGYAFRLIQMARLHEIEDMVCAPRNTFGPVHKDYHCCLKLTFLAGICTGQHTYSGT